MSSGSRIVATWFLVFAAPVADRAARPRVGVVASRKVGGAVCRSHAKRRLRELYRRSPFRPPADLVLVARRGICGAPWPRLVTAYRSALDKLSRRLRQGRGRGAARLTAKERTR